MITFEFLDLVVLKVWDVRVCLEYPIARCLIKILVVIEVLQHVLMKVIALKLLNILESRRYYKQRWAQSFGNVAWPIEEGVVNHLENVKARTRRGHQDSSNKVFGHNRDLLMLREMVVVASNTIVSFLYIIRVKGWFTRQECENNDTDCPNIDFEGVFPLRI